MQENTLVDFRTLHVRGLGCSRGGRRVFSDIDLAVAPKQALVLTGANGAGKSSLLMCLSGLIPFDGVIDWQGRDPERERPGTDLHFISHQTALKPNLTLVENLAFWADLMGGARERVAPALKEARLDHAADLPAALLSAGQTRRLALCRLLVAPRPVWLLDEPTSALDAQGSDWVGELIGAHLDRGGLAIVATHLPLAIAGTVRTLALGAPS